METFIYTAQPARVIFGDGSLERLGEEMARLGAQRALLLTTPSQRRHAQQITAMFGDKVAGIFDRSAMHVPIELAREATVLAQALGADCAVAIGGGSTIGLGKAIALNASLPILAIPTTYAGSEMTPIYGITAMGLKKTGRDERVLPRTVIYDPNLSESLPLGPSMTSAFNAIAHAVEGMYAQERNPVMSWMAQEGIRSMVGAISKIAQSPQDKDARRAALRGAWLCGTVLGHVGMALHHKLCHTLGGSFNLPHAEVHTVLLPHVMAYNAVAEPKVMNDIAEILGSVTAAGGMQSLARRVEAPLALKALGMPEADLDQATDIAMESPYWNPRPLERTAIRALLQNAWEGQPLE
ncbi:maleylacetate reductase [Achromobacter anxifer]|uniref:maleylacetate reductase n=1 Tax=Achromobacter anxifer TaxID=1287737 RepID=UPI0023F79260|nr:maleylacetate reductase [Achromobacter anxifer]MDF8364738.1 maleylacetate reductase [Achromobacter anxifer]